MPHVSAESLAAQPLQHFLNDLASAEPVPGGGSVAALAGSLAASLVAMVCRLTIGKKGYESVSTEMQSILPRAKSLQQELRDLMQADIDAYACVMDCYGLPKETDAEKTARSQAIQEALKDASLIPMRVAEYCSDVLDLARIVAEKGNKNAASDGAVGALMAQAGLRGAAFNVIINLGSIKDEAFVKAYREFVKTLVSSSEKTKNEILAIVEKRM